MHLRWVLLLLLWLPVKQLFADYPIEIIELKHQTVEQIIPVIKPFLRSGDSVTGIRGQLIVKTAPENFPQIMKIITRFDRPSRQLMIYVAQGDFSRTTRGNAQLIAGNPPSSRRGVSFQGQGVTANLNSQKKILDDNITQRVRATEGMPAFIKTGTILPIPVETRQGIGHASGTRISYGYGEASSGFYVIPQIHGQRVTLQISPRRQKPNPGYGVDIAEISTQITGQIGEWIEIGGNRSQINSRQSYIVGGGRVQQDTYRPVRVLVQVLAK